MAQQNLIFYMNPNEYFPQIVSTVVKNLFLNIWWFVCDIPIYNDSNVKKTKKKNNFY